MSYISVMPGLVPVKYFSGKKSLGKQKQGVREAVAAKSIQRKVIVKGSIPVYNTKKIRQVTEL